MGEVVRIVIETKTLPYFVVIKYGADFHSLYFFDVKHNRAFFARLYPKREQFYSALKMTLKAEIDEEAWGSLYSDTSQPFEKVINHLGNDVVRLFRV